MGRNIYSLLLIDEVILALDELAQQRGESRSQLANEILADYLSVSTPEKQMKEILEQIEHLFSSSELLRLSVSDSGAILSAKSYLQYKYSPSVRYRFELFRQDKLAVGKLKVLYRTQNPKLGEILNDFFVLWQSFERIYLGSFLPISQAYELENDKFQRKLFWPNAAVSNEQLGESIGTYIQNFDQTLKTYFSLLHLDSAKRRSELEQLYRKNLAKQGLIL